MPVAGRTGSKRIQRGLITFASGDLQASNTIQAIDMNKSEIRWNGTGGGTVQDVQWEITEW